MIFFHRRCIARSASNYVEIESFFIKKYYGLKSFIKKDNLCVNNKMEAFVKWKD